VGERLIAVPATPQPAFLPQADGIVGRVRRGKTGVTVLAPQSREVERLVVAGCDPAIGLAVSLMERSAAVEVLPVAASSRLALEWLHSGKIHIAGAHLRDNASGEFNLPVLKREYPRDDLAVVTFAHWEAGLVCAPGNPKRLRGVEDLARRSVRFVNREAGSGSRALLDRLLAQSGVPASKVRGYDRVALGHLAAAHAVFTGSADVCLATRSAARAFALDFVPLERERYDLIVRREMLRHPGVSVFLDVLQRASLRRLLEHHAGYDVAATGSVLA
jgi:molybdate-binding protein